jgi:pimeloyl-ACP methyl ester carboxylesterase
MMRISEWRAISVLGTATTALRLATTPGIAQAITAARRFGRARTVLFLSAVVVVASLSSAPGPAAELELSATGRSTAEGLHPCAEATDRCEGTIEVPLDRSEPSSERIEVAFAFKPRADQSRPATGTVLAYLGSGQHIPLVPTLQQVLGPVLERQNLLVVDPRGTGRSSPLTCPGLDAADPGTIAACAEQLGPRIQFFASDQHAADLDAVRAALGLPKVTFYGNSYGTVFAQAYATRFPEHLAAVFLDSVVPMNDDGYRDQSDNFFTWNLAAGQRMHNAICNASVSCRRLPGSTKDRLGKVLQRLRAHPDPSISSKSRLLTMSQYPHDAVFGREFNAALDSYVSGDPAALRRLSALLDRVFGPPARLALPRAGGLAYVCADSAFPFDRSAGPVERREQLDRYYAEEQPFAPFTRDEMEQMLGPAASSEECVGWPTPRPSPVVPPGADYPDIPVLVVNGEHDTTTAPEGARLVADRFPSATYQEINYGPHASSLGLTGPASQCANAIMRDFIAAPRYPMPDRNCSAENYRALGRFPTRIRDVSPAGGPGLTANQGRIVAAAYATAQDAASRRNPYAEFYRLDPTGEEPGLRGGTLRLPPDGPIQLDQVRYVGDLAVTGRIAIAGDGTATADLDLAGASQATLELTWQPYQATDRISITGTLNDRPFHVIVRTS